MSEGTGSFIFDTNIEAVRQQLISNLNGLATELRSAGSRLSGAMGGTSGNVFGQFTAGIEASGQQALSRLQQVQTRLREEVARAATGGGPVAAVGGQPLGRITTSIVGELQRDIAQQLQRAVRTAPQGVDTRQLTAAAQSANEVVLQSVRQAYGAIRQNVGSFANSLGVSVPGVSKVLLGTGADVARFPTQAQARTGLENATSVAQVLRSTDNDTAALANARARADQVRAMREDMERMSRTRVMGASEGDINAAAAQMRAMREQVDQAHRIITDSPVLGRQRLRPQPPVVDSETGERAYLPAAQREQITGAGRVQGAQQELAEYLRGNGAAIGSATEAVATLAGTERALTSAELALIRAVNDRTARLLSSPVAPVGPTTGLAPAGKAGGLTLYHGGLPVGTGMAGIDLNRPGSQQNKAGRSYGGFYLTDETSRGWSQDYAQRRNGNLSSFQISPTARIAETDRVIDRISAEERAMLARDHDLIKGKDTLGRSQYALLNKDAVVGMSERNVARPDAEIAQAREQIRQLKATAAQDLNEIDKAQRGRAGEAQAEARARLNSLGLPYAPGGAGVGGGGGLAGGPPRDPFGAFLAGAGSRGFSGGKDVPHDFSGIAATAGTTVKYALLYQVLGKVQQAFTDTKKEVLDYRDSLTDLNVAMGQGGLVTDAYINKLEGLSRLAGSNVGAALDTAARGVRAFGEIPAEPGDKDAGAIAKRNLQVGLDTATAASQLAVITDKSLKDVTGDQIAIASAFKISSDQFSQINDAIANAKKSGGDPGQVSQGLANFAQSAHEAGLTLIQAANIVGKVQSTLDETGQAAATRLTRIFSIMGSAGGQEEIRNLGVDTTQPISQQLAGIADKLQGMPEERRKSITARLSGTGNLRELEVLLANQSQLLDLDDRSARKAGAGLQEYMRKNSDLAGLMRKIQGDISTIQVNLYRSGILDVFGGGARAIEPFLHALADVTKLIDLMPGPLKHVIGLYIDYLAILKLVEAVQRRTAAQGVRSAGATIAGGAAGAGGAAASTAAHTEEAAAVQLANQTKLRGLVIDEATARASVASAAEVAAASRTRLAAASEAAQAARRTGLNTERAGAIELEYADAMSAAARATEALTAAQLRQAAIQREVTALTELDSEAALVNAKSRAAQAAANEAVGLSAVGGAAAVGLSRNASVLGGAGAYALGLGRTNSQNPEGPKVAPTRGSKLLAGAIYLTIAVEVVNAIRGVHEKNLAAERATNTAGHALEGATTVDELQGAAQRYREAAAAQGRRSTGFFGAIYEGVQGDPNKDRARDLRATAKQIDDQVKVQQEAQRVAAQRGDIGVFQTFDAQGLTDGLKLLTDAGKDADSIIRTLTTAMRDFNSTGEKGPGTILPGQAPALVQGLAAGAYGALPGAVMDYLTTTPGGLRPRPGQKMDPALGYLSPRDYANRYGVDLPNSPEDTSFLHKIGPHKNSDDIVASDYAKLIAQRLKGTDKDFDNLDKKVKDTIATFLREHGVDQNGGHLSGNEIDDLANQIANQFYDPKLNEQDNRVLHTAVQRAIADQIRGATDPDKFVVDQQTANVYQQIITAQAAARQQQDVAGGADPIDAARKRLAEVQHLEAFIQSKNLDVAGTTFQDETSAQNDLADALNARSDAELAYQQALLGDDPVGRARLAYIEMQRRVTQFVYDKINRDLGAFAAFADPGAYDGSWSGTGMTALDTTTAGIQAKTAAVEASNSLAQQQRQTRSAEDQARAALEGHAGDQASTTRATADAARAAMRNAQTTAEYLQALKQLQDAEYQMRVDAVNLTNAFEQFNLRPGDAYGHAVAAVDAAARQVTLTYAGTVEYFQAMTAWKEAVYGQQQAWLTLANSRRELQWMRPGDSESQAAVQLGEARDALGLAQNSGGETEINQAQIAVRQREYEYAQAQLATRQAFRNANDGGVGNRLQAANIDVANARDALNQSTAGTKEYYDLLAQLNQAEFTYAQELLGHAQAVHYAQRRAGDAMAAANDAVNETLAAVGAAVPGSTEYFQAIGAHKDAIYQQQQTTLRLHAAQREAGVTPGDSVGEARVARDSAREAYNAAQGVVERAEALVAFRQAQAAYVAALRNLGAQYRNAHTVTGDPVAEATTAVRNAADVVHQTKAGTAEYWAAVADYNNAIEQLAQTQAEAASQHRMLSIDLTDPVAMAREETRKAMAKLAHDRARGAGADVLDTDTNAVRNAQAAEEAAAFNQRLSDMQTNERLGRITHDAYMKYLQDEHDRLTAVQNRTRQQQDELNQIDEAMKAAADQMQGQWNIGDIRIPTGYEVRRAVASQNSGIAYNYSQGNYAAAASTTSYNTDNRVQTLTLQFAAGTDTAAVTKAVTNALGASIADDRVRVGTVPLR